MTRLPQRIVAPLGELGGEVPPAAPGSSPAREIEALQRQLRASRAAEATARAEAERSNRAKDEFLAMLGHQLRNPLAAISSAVSVLNSPGTSAELTAAALEIAERQTHELARLLDDLLDPARQGGGPFDVRLPAIDAPPEPGTAPERAGTWGIAPRRIVLIEDNADTAQSLQACLELDGHDVRSAADGATGLALLLAERPDAAIVDLGLPGLNGFDVALRSRAAGFPGLMVATLGQGQEADTRRALRSGFDALLVKPVDTAQLRALLASEGSIP